MQPYITIRVHRKEGTAKITEESKGQRIGNGRTLNAHWFLRKKTKIFAGDKKKLRELRLVVNP